MNDNQCTHQSIAQDAATPVDISGLDSDAIEICRRLEDRYGPLLRGKALAAVLGHGSVASLRQARLRGHVPVTLFTLPNRRGHFALAKDVAEWLAHARAKAIGAR